MKVQEFKLIPRLLLQLFPLLNHLKHDRSKYLRKIFSYKFCFYPYLRFLDDKKIIEMVSWHSHINICFNFYLFRIRTLKVLNIK